MAKVDFKDYYKLLEVERSADEATIRSAFRKAARKNHPDVNPGDKGAEERFKEVNEAYEVLSDPDKRKMYDRYGEDWQRYRDAGYTGDEPPFSTGGGSSRGTGGQDFGSWFSGQQGGSGYTTFDDSDDGFSDFFQTMFGGSRRRASREYTQAAPRPRRGQDLDADVEVSFNEAFNGTTRQFDVQSQESCPHCGGTGVIRGQECPGCDGTGVVPKRKTIEVRIPKGVATGSRVRVANQGGPGAAGGPNGDVYLVVNVRPDPRFEREGNDLRTEIDLPLYTAVLGGETTVTTPTGKVALTIPAGTQQGKVFRLRGQGMPKLKSPESRGDLLARVNVQVPEDLTDRERELFAELRDLRKGAK